MSRSGEGAPAARNEIIDSSHGRFARAHAEAEVTIEIPREEPSVEAAAAPAPEPEQSSVRPKSEWLDINGKPGERSALEKKTWWETYHEMNDVMKYPEIGAGESLWCKRLMRQ